MRGLCRWEAIAAFFGIRRFGVGLGESGKEGAECSRKGASGRRVAGVIRSLVNARGCSLSVLGSCMSHCSCLCLCMVVRQ